MKNIFGLLFIFIIIISVIGSSSDIKEENNNLIKEKRIKVHTKTIPQMISEKRSESQFKNVSIFSFVSNVHGNENAASFVSDASLLNISKEFSGQALRKREENIVFSIPISETGSIELELTRSYPVTDDFTLINKNGNNNIRENYVPGLHYSGIIKGKENSVASVSIFKDFVMGIISDENGNYVLGSIKNADNTYSDNYIFYNDADLTVKNKFKCGVDDYEEKFIKAIDNSANKFDGNQNSDNLSRLPVKVYFEADNKMYTDAGNSTQAVSDFITGMFNSVMTIYQNENVPFVISQIGVWTVADPYRNLNDSYEILLKFGVINKDDFQGNIAHLLTTRTAGLGGIAWIRVLCSEFNSDDSSGRYAFSNIDPNYNNFPTYSWTVNVVTHEMGHSLGSRHSHSCVWPAGPGGSIRAIDSCYTAEGGCFPAPRARIGTIMSYCHLWTASQGGGVNLSLGFGPFPGDTIRLRYAQALCLDRVLNSSERPTVFDLAQNFPNPYNPSTVISFAVPVESSVSLKVFDMNGRLVADLISNEFYAPGFYDYRFNSSVYGLSSGIYFYSLVSDGRMIDTKRMVLIK